MVLLLLGAHMTHGWQVLWQSSDCHSCSQPVLTVLSGDWGQDPTAATTVTEAVISPQPQRLPPVSAVGNLPYQNTQLRWANAQVGNTRKWGCSESLVAFGAAERVELILWVELIRADMPMPLSELNTLPCRETLLTSQVAPKLVSITLKQALVASAFQQDTPAGIR
jgi:hypothetical protein